MRKLVLHIDRLVLRNVTARESTAIASAMKAELRRLLARPRAAAGGPGERRDTSRARAKQGKPAERIGTQIARAIRREVRR